ncbi:MAG TPA: AraC family transcriptional regulator ligand-binding domain-containing protein [Polyangiales bacterium]|nr:AraC family transcriptional regulator ligand-binding domain-containing protein [Polyangiales bacterium]
MRIGSSTHPPEPSRVVAGHFLRAAAGFSAIPSWMEQHALTAMSPSARQRVWAVGRRFTGNPDHGFAIAERVPADGVGSLWALFRSAPDLATLHRIYPRVAPLLVDSMQCSWREGEHSVQLSFTLADGVRADRAEEDSRAALQVKTWRLLHGDAIAPISVSFSYARPRSTTAHVRALHTRDVRFDQPALGLELALHWWRAPLPSADAQFEHRLALAERQVQALAETSIEQRVEGLLMQRMSTDARTESVAALLGVSVRTLHRQLAHAGTSFRALTERARRREDALFTEASALFGFRTLSLGERARLLGFANTGALRNALRRWAGRS